ncbi:MAG: ABC-type uncharacterized transport system involved in gliding motility auxiliary subunit [Planctomycetota bacterium]|jgi:ABC-type uncharacterized transport system involved in gliding motility auxiliary subunit
MQKQQMYWASFGIALVLLFGVNILSASTLRSARLDLTEDALYSLSEGTHNILAELPEPVKLRFFFSEKLSNDQPALRTYAIRVQELLQEYVLLSDGQISLEIIEPESFSEAEDRAVEAGIAPLAMGNGGEKFYLGMVGTSSLDEELVIPLFNPQDEALLEYEITKLIYRLSHPNRAVMGIITTLDMQGSPSPDPRQPQAGTPPMAILTQLEEQFEVRMFGAALSSVPSDIDVLMIIHPKDLDARTKYAIDQFVLAGGRALVLVDAFAELDSPSDPNDQMAVYTHQRGSNLDPLLEAWGLRMPVGKIAADRKTATKVGIGGRSLDYVLWLTLDNSNYNADDPVISQLDKMIIPSSGFLEEVEDTDIVITPLIQTSHDSMQIDQSQVQFGPDPEALLRNFVPEDDQFMLAARATGPASSAFPGGKPTKSATENITEPLEGSDADVPHLAESTTDINVIVIADVDLLNDTYWLRRETLGPIFLGYRKTADNGDFLINSVDNLSGSNDLISIRGRQKFARPFEYVKEIERAAEQKYLREVQGLQEKIQATEQRIAELGRDRSDASSALILSPEQQAEIEKLREEQLSSRRELRAVQHELSKDIESLGMRLKLVHIGAVPLLFSLGAFALHSLRRKSRRA